MSGKKGFEEMRNLVRSCRFVRSLSILGIVLFVGCATSAPKPEFTQEIAPESQIKAVDEAKVIVEASPGCSVVENDKTRIAQRIQEKLAAKKVLNNSGGETKEYEVCVTLTRYEKGNAFARAMLAGLGQIHIDGNVSLFELPERKKAGEFTIKKTFAWGGIYGGSTSIEDVELGFADGIASALTGREEEAPKKKQKSEQVGMI